jgi:uncharacterized protein (TIGR02246 family)
MTAPRSREQHASDPVQDAIRELDADVRRHIQAGDADAMVDSYYAEDGRVLPPGQGEVQGKVAIREMWRALVASGMVDLVLETGHIETAGDLAFGTGTARATVHPAGSPPVILEGRYAVAFRRQPDGAWRNIVDMYTIDSERPADT